MKCWISANYPVSSTERIDTVGQVRLSVAAVPLVEVILVIFQRSSDQLTELLAKGCQLLDLRTAGEYSNNTAKSALNVFLAELHQQVGELDK